MLRNPWIRAPEGYSGSPIGEGELPAGVASLIDRKLGRDRRPGFGYISTVFIGHSSVVKLDRYPGRTGRFNHERAMAEVRLPDAEAPRLLDQGVVNGYEWIEQSLVPGVPAYEVWPSLEDHARRQLVERVAECIRTLHEFEPDVRLLHARFEDWRSHVTAALAESVERARGVIPDEALRRVEDCREGWSPWLETAELATCHGDLWFGNVFVDEHGRLTGIIDWDRLAVAPPEYELDMLWRFWRYPWNFVPEHLEAAFADPLIPALLRPIVSVCAGSMETRALGARLSMLELAYRVGIAARFGWSAEIRGMLETVLSGGWTEGLTER